MRLCILEPLDCHRAGLHFTPDQPSHLRTKVVQELFDLGLIGVAAVDEGYEWRIDRNVRYGFTTVFLVPRTFSNEALTTANKLLASSNLGQLRLKQPPPVRKRRRLGLPII